MIKRPGMFRWVSNQPTKQILIASGDALWIYDVDLQQATKQRLSSRTRIDPAMLLSGSVKNLESAFIVTMKTKKQQTTFTLKPKDSNYGFGKVEMIFDSKKLTAMTVLNNLSQTTEFKFSNIKLDKPLLDSLFNFKAPKGVDVISQ